MSIKQQLRSFIEQLVSSEDPAEEWKNAQAEFDEITKALPKKKKHPDAPKGKCSAYVLFCREVRDDIRREHPEMSTTEITAELGRVWKEDIEEEEKDEYKRMAEEDKERYEEEYAAFIAKHPEEAVIKKGKKAPHAPKGARSAYILFCQDERENVVYQSEGLSAKEVLTELGRRWREEVDAETKQEYKEKAAEDKQRYQDEYEEFASLYPDEAEQMKSKSKSKSKSTKSKTKSKTKSTKTPKKKANSSTTNKPKSPFDAFVEDRVYDLVAEMMADEYETDDPFTEEEKAEFVDQYKEDIDSRLEEEWNDRTPEQNEKYEQISDESKEQYQDNRTEKRNKSLMTKKRDELVDIAVDLGISVDKEKKSEIVEMILKAKKKIGKDYPSDSDSDSNQSDGSQSEDELSKMSAKELKELARERGIDSKLKKKELIAKLLEGDKTEKNTRNEDFKKFCKENRSRLVEDNPDMTPMEISKALLEEYKNQ